MLLSISGFLACMVLVLAVAVKAQNPRNVAITSYAGNNRCTGASVTRTFPTRNNACRPYPAGGALSYELNRDDDDCFITSFADANCSRRIARREFENDDDNDGDDSDCEGLPSRARSFRIRCFRDIDD